MSETSNQARHPAHGIVLRMGGRDIKVRPTFALSADIEERFGPIFETAQRVLERKASILELADLLVVMTGASANEVQAHFDEVGLGGVITEVSGSFAQIMRGWRAIGDQIEASPAGQEAVASGAENPPARSRGRPRGVRNKPKPDVSPGATSSAAPADSASCPASSGQSPLTNLPASGEPLAALPATSNANGLAVLPQPPATSAHTSELFPATA